MSTLWRRSKDTTITLRVPKPLKEELKKILKHYKEQSPSGYSSRDNNIKKDKHMIDIPDRWKTISQSDILESLVVREYQRLIDEGFII